MAARADPAVLPAEKAHVVGARVGQGVGGITTGPLYIDRWCPWGRVIYARGLLHALRVSAKARATTKCGRYHWRRPAAIMVA